MAVEMVGPGGPDGCSKFRCVKKAVSVYLYSVDRIGQKAYDVRYKWCSEHDHLIDHEHYPYFILKEHHNV